MTPTKTQSDSVNVEQQTFEDQTNKDAIPVAVQEIPLPTESPNVPKTVEQPELRRLSRIRKAPDRLQM